MRAKFVNEKFTEDSDPISDMGIGEMNKEINFKTEKEFFNWLIEHLHLILKKEETPEDIIYCKDSFMKAKYKNKIDDYIGKYLSINGENADLSNKNRLMILYYRLRKLGFKEPKGYEYEVIQNKRGNTINVKKYLKESLNEKFTEEGDPIKDMNIGYGKKLLTIAFKILMFIASKKEEGASFTEIQHFIWTELWGGSEKSFWKKERIEGHTGEYPRLERRSRGTYCIGLCGWSGLLRKWCVKNPKNNKWVLKRMPRPGENLTK